MLQRRSVRIAFYVLAGVLILCAAAFLFRASLTQFLVENYLSEQGAPARVTITRLDSEGLTLKLTAGPHEAPDASADRIDVAFGPGRYGRRVESVTLTGAFMHIRYDGKRITYGSLTDFIDRMIEGPSGESDFVATDLPVALNSLRVRVTTQGGFIDLIGEGAIRGSKIEWLNLRGADGRIGLYGYGYSYRADVRRLVLAITGASSTVLNIQGSLDAAVQGNVDIESLKLSFVADGVKTGETISIPHLKLSAAVKLDDKQAEKFAAAIPYWSGDAENHAALKAALSDFRLDAPDLALSLSGTSSVVLNAPLTGASQSGAVFSLSGAALTAAGAGQANLSATMTGGGIRPLALHMPRATWQSAGTRTEGEADVALGFTAQMLRDANVRGKFAFVTGGIDLGIGLKDCADLSMAGLRSGKSLVATRVTTKVCALGDQPVYAMDTRGWHARLRFEGGKAHIVAADAQLSAGSGEAMIDGQGDPQTGIVTIKTARLSDALRKPRFAALKGAGKITLANGIWHGDIDMSAGRGSRLGKVRFSHVLATGAGQAVIDARGIKFTEKGLQPVDLSPLLVNVAKAQGTAHFNGSVTWTSSGKLASRGELAVEDSKFATPLGTAHGGSVKIKFSSLVPLVAAPGQDAEVEKIDWVSALTQSFAKFGFTQEKLTLQAAGTNAAKGSIRLDPLTVYFESRRGIEGRLVLEHVDLGQLLADSNLGEDVKIEARISGSVPFELDDKGFRIKEGRIAADGPGRLMIKRSLWLGSRTTVPNAMEDFAYQALENLAFEKLEGTLNSLPGGRMQLVFHMIGRNDPAVAQEATIEVLSLIKGEAFQKPMPLPKGTPIDLTLDTNLNFDEVLRAYRDAWADTKAENRERVAK